LNLFTSFVLLPFTYFYGEERSEYMDFIDADQGSEVCSKLYSAMKYTVRKL